MNRADYDRNLAALNARDITVRGKGGVPFDSIRYPSDQPPDRMIERG